MERYRVVTASGAMEFQRALNEVASEGYVMIGSHHVFEEDSHTMPNSGRTRYSAVMELEPVEFDAMAFQKQYFGSINN